MNAATLAAGYLRARPLSTLLSVVLLAIGVAMIAMLVLVFSQIEDRMQRDARGIDLVVGAKGSPMQLILSGIFHIDAPTGNIPFTAVNDLARERMVRTAIPLALGDSVGGFRIAGAPKEYLDHYEARFASGRLWEKPMEAVLGAEAAATLRLSVGGSFSGAHGISGEGALHADSPYTVTGVLAPTGSVLDRLVLTSIDSVWAVHETHHEPADAADRKALEDDREVTVVLIRYASPLAAAMLPRRINAQSELQAASPALETARLFRIVGVGVDALRSLAALLVLAAGFSVFIALTSALEERRLDLAIMRTLGASPARLFSFVFVEAMLLVAIGTALGLALGHAATTALGAWLADAQGLRVTGLAWRHEEFTLVGAAFAVGALAALVPAWRARRTDVARTLAQA